MMRITFLGSSCSMPTKERNLSSVAINFDGSLLLFDCPEGTQRQMMKAGVSHMKVSHIFFSHFHADHFLGLPGLVATMSMQERKDPLFVFGPEGIKEQVRKVLNLAMMRKSFPIIAEEVRKGKVLEGKNFFVEAFPLKHEVPCFGFVLKQKDKAGEFQRSAALKLGIPEGPLWSKLQKGENVKVNGKVFRPEQVLDYSQGRVGKKVAIVLDTLPDKKYFSAIKDSDLLIHEGAFLEDLAERAKETAHSTVKQAAQVAKRVNAKKLVINHVSPRYKDARKIEKEAKSEFENSVVAEDLMEINL